MKTLTKTAVVLWVVTCALVVLAGIMYLTTPEDGGANIGLGLLVMFVLPAAALVTLGTTIAAVIVNRIHKAQTLA